MAGAGIDLWRVVIQRRIIPAYCIGVGGKVRNPKISNASGTKIDLEINHPVHGWIPFTASAGDVELFGREMHARALAGEFGAVAAYSGPDAAALAALKRKAEIIAELSRLDLDSIRALRAKAAGKGKQADDTRLATLNARADELRVELAALGV